jgi:hypothetical protein
MITDALLSLVPGAQWSIIDEDYDSLVWSEGNTQTKPTLEEVQAEVARLKAIADAKKYQQQRKSEYPSIQEQLDTLYHGGYDAWKAQVKAIKDKYPKG